MGWSTIPKVIKFVKPAVHKTGVERAAAEALISAHKLKGSIKGGSQKIWNKARDVHKTMDKAEKNLKKLKKTTEETKRYLLNLPPKKK